MTSRSRILTAIVFSLLFSLPLGAQEAAGRLISSQEEGWPQFRGPSRSGISAEKNLLQSWPEGGPKRLWKVSGIGAGYSHPVISQGSLYITGDVEEDLVIFAYDLDGNLKWKTKNGLAWKGSYPGARTSCVYEAGRLYHTNAHGRAVCLDARDGREIWAVDILNRFDGQNIKWGMAGCPLLDGESLIVVPGGKKALIAALDKRTGATLWASEPLRFMRTQEVGGKEVNPPQSDTDNSGYAPTILFEIGGRRLIAGCSASHFFIVDATSGKILWTKHVPVRYEVIGATPVFCGDSVFFCAPDQFGGLMVKIEIENQKPRFEALWNTNLDNCHGALVHVDGRLYGSGYKKFPRWACIDAKSGQTLYTQDDMAIGTLIHADNRLYAQSQEGRIFLLNPTDKEFQTKGSFTVVEKPKRKDFWAHPVVLDGKLYLRYHDDLFCYDIQR